MTLELRHETEGPVHRLVLNRTARRNALTPELARDLSDEIEQISEDGDASVVLLSGAGGHFCVGLDLHWLRSLGGTPGVTELQRGLSAFQSAVLAIARCPLPVIAVIQGTTAGFGLDLALACDLRLAGASATFASAFARMALVPDGGSTFTLPRLIGVGSALRILFAGETLDSSRARAIGLVDDVFEDDALDEGVRRFVGTLVGNAASSIRTIKRLVRAPEIGALEQALSTEGAAQLQALQGSEFHRRLEAFAARTGSRVEGA